jgi:hypothetical protein
MTSPSEREEIVRLFRLYGVDGQIRQAHELRDDERVYVITSEQAAMMDEAGLTRALTQLLGRKVWIATEGAAWSGRTEPL